MLLLRLQLVDCMYPVTRRVAVCCCRHVVTVAIRSDFGHALASRRRKQSNKTRKWHVAYTGSQFESLERRLDMFYA